jgi:hypothetical protein
MEVKKTVEKVNWDNVRTIIKNELGKEYSKGYIMGVANGSNGNKKMREVLERLGVIK